MHHNHEYVDQALGDRFELVVPLLWELRANFEYVHNISGNRLELAVPLAAQLVGDVMVEAGQPFGIQLCGEWAIDVARVEAGLLIPGPDYANAGPDRTGSHTP